MRIPIQVLADSPEPIYHQIEVQLRALILSGTLAAGTLLPSIREFAQDLSCSVITIRRVYQDLENEGLLRTRQGTGTFVAQVETDDRERYRMEAVYHAFREAVEAGLRVQLTYGELRDVFEAVVKEKTDKDTGGGDKK